MKRHRVGTTLAVIALTGLLWGCGTTSSTKNPEDTDFFMVSTGSASLVYKAFVGGVDYCKVTKHGVPHNDFAGSIDWDGETCKVRAEISDE